MPTGEYPENRTIPMVVPIYKKVFLFILLGYLGEECALVEGSSPVLHYIPGPGLCDLTLRPCWEFRLVASRFTSDDLTCRVTELASRVGILRSKLVHSTGQGKGMWKKGSVE